MATSGLATVLFTDIVGSTRLRDQPGDDVAVEIGAEHDRIIGDTLASSGGLDRSEFTRSWMFLATSAGVLA